MAADKRREAILVRAANEFGGELRNRGLPAVRLTSVGEPTPTNTGGWCVQVASVGQRPDIWAWYDRYIDGISYKLWFGFGSDAGADQLVQMIKNMSDPPEIGKRLHSIKDEALPEPFWHLRDPLLPNILSKPILETYPPDGKSGFGLYQLEDTSTFVRRAVDFIEQALRGLPENAPSLEDSLSLEALRAIAIAAATTPPTGGKTSRTYYQRSAAVRTYVLARAEGICEACGVPAPFTRTDGKPYLETHHIEMLADGGPDHPRVVAAVCPNCHREIHHGANREKVNARARETARKKEPAEDLAK